MPTLTPKNKKVVITGASSGIGRATALAFAEEGASLLLGSRNIEKLAEVVAECKKRGSPFAACVVTDVTVPESVEELADQATRLLGGIDVWVNNAGTGAVGAYWDSPLESHLQVVRTNLLGGMYGAHAAMKRFKAQKYGTLINLNSLGCWVPIPYAASYSASKFGLFGFMEALRGEVKDEKNIHVCDLMPSFVDTPGFTHAANYSGTGLRPFPPLLSPERVASKVVQRAKSPKNRSPIGVPTFVLRSVYFLFPDLLMTVMKGFLDFSFKVGTKVPHTDGTIFQTRREESRSAAGQQKWNIVPALGLLALGVGGIYLMSRNREKITDSLSSVKERMRKAS